MKTDPNNWRSQKDAEMLAKVKVRKTKTVEISDNG